MDLQDFDVHRFIKEYILTLKLPRFTVLINPDL